MENLVPHFLELIRRAATDLPADIEAALHRARDAEDAGTAAQTTFDAILENVRMSRAASTPICQDTHRHAHLLRLLSDRVVDPRVEEADP